MEDQLNWRSTQRKMPSRILQQKMTSMEDNLNGKQSQQKTTTVEDDLNGRWPQWKMTSMKYKLIGHLATPQFARFLPFCAAFCFRQDLHYVGPLIIIGPISALAGVGLVGFSMELIIRLRKQIKRVMDPNLLKTNNLHEVKHWMEPGEWIVWKLSDSKHHMIIWLEILFPKNC